MCWQPVKPPRFARLCLKILSQSWNGTRVDGKGVEEHGIDTATGKTVVKVDPRYFRPTEVDQLLGDATKARERLGWRHETNIDELIAEMVREDLKVIARLVPLSLASGGIGHD
jgi:GDPmannose 4,6-dehydratase